jgi:hypothetical protein
MQKLLKADSSFIKEFKSELNQIVALIIKSLID